MLCDIAIPVPEDYEVSKTLGFLPVDPPHHSRLDPYYTQWVKIASGLPNMLAAKQVRTTVDSLPILASHRLRTTSDLRCAYSMLAFISHAYIWEGPEPSKVVPPSISRPFLWICKSLEVPPVATYAAVCLWNSTPIASDEPLDIVENLASERTFTGTTDEGWFYNISVAVEARGAPMIEVLLDAIRFVRAGDSSAVAAQLLRLGAGVQGLCAVLRRMYEGCDPGFFYHRLRPYLAGSSSVGPRGVVFDVGDASAPSVPVRYAGGSNAQSSLVQFLDIGLGVGHRPTKLSGFGRQPSDRAARADYIADMRHYMPGPHRRFLQHLALVANIRPFVLASPAHDALRSAYDASITALVALREIHLEMVSRYIVLPQTLANKAERPPALEDGDEPMGTGGTTAIPFLKQSRDETYQAGTNHVLCLSPAKDVPWRGRSVLASATRLTRPAAAPA